MARGDAEMACLDVIRQHAVKKAYSGGYTLSDRNSWFGLHYIQGVEDDLVKLGNIIMTCMPNPDLNKFPDFIFKDGFIEHFKVSASDRDGRGFEAIAKSEQNRIKSERKLKARNEFDLDMNPDKQIAISFEITKYLAPEQSYDVFYKSFRTHWEKHINSLYKYDGCRNIGVFLIECPDIGFSMAEDTHADYPKAGVHVGSLRKEPEIFKSLRISRCVELLEYMHKYREEIQYVIYICFGAIEIFRTDELMYIASLIRHPYLKHGCRGLSTQSNFCTTTRYDKSAGTE